MPDQDRIAKLEEQAALTYKALLQQAALIQQLLQAVELLGDVVFEDEDPATAKHVVH